MNAIQRFLDSAKDALDGGGLTPLQIQEIETAITAHEQCDLIDNVALRDQRDRIENHWISVSSTMSRHARTQHVIRLFAHSFAGLLLEEYCNLEPPFHLVAMREYMNMFGTAKQRQEAADKLTGGDTSRLDPLYEETIAFSITELVLDREHVERRLRNALTGGRLTEKLVQSGDDSGLREVIEKDLASFRQLVLFRPGLEKVQYCVNSMAQGMLQQLPTVHSSSRKASSWRAAMGGILWGSSGTSPRLGESLSPACLLLSDREIAKTV